MFIRTDKDHNIITYPYSLEQFRLDHKNMSLPQFLNNRFLAAHDVYPVYAATEPEIVNLTQFALRDIDNPYRDVDGEWRYGWIVRDKTAEQIQIDKDLHNAEQKKNREEAYKQESDPNFFKVQRGEVSMEEWLALIESIKQRFPYQE